MCRIISQLQQLGDEDKAVVCIRHGERNTIPPGEFGDNVSLSDAGIAAAVKFGSELSRFRISTVYTSPIPRCVQTAKCIQEGIGRDITIVGKNELGAPGLHIQDAEIAGKVLLKHGIRQFYDDYVQNRKIAGVNSKTKLKNAFLDFFRKTAGENQGISLYITHDLLIALFENACFNKVYGNDEWVGFLDGFVLKI